MATDLLQSLANDYATLVNLNPALRPQAWVMTALKSTNRTNVFSKFEGPEGSGAPVLRKDDPTKGQGQTVNFTVVAPLGGEPRRGSQILQGNEELVKEGTFSLTIDIVRHATGTTAKFDLANSVKLQGMAPALLGQHCGWTQEWDMMSWMKLFATTNVMRPNYKSSREQLRSADVISPSLLDQGKEIAMTNGALPFKVAKSKAGYPMNNFLFFSPHPALTQFRESSQWSQAMQYADDRGEKNGLFTGAYPNWNGTVIFQHETVDSDAFGPIGSAFCPKAKLGIPITSGTAAVTITGGATVAGANVGQSGGTEGLPPMYFKGFSNYAYQWAGDSQSPAVPNLTQNRYVLIFNMTASTAGNDAGKWGFYCYVTNNGNTLTTTAYQASNPDSLLGAGGPSGGRLGGTANGGGADTRHTIVGNVTWNATYNTDQHPSGSLIVETNSYGVAFAFSVVMGAECVCRGYGKGGIKPIRNVLDYENIRNNGYQSIYGQAIRTDTDGNPRGYILVEHAINYAGVNLPTV